MKNRILILKLSILNFLEFAVWGAYLISLGRYLGNQGLGSQIKWFFAMQGVVSIFMPPLIGAVADRHIPAQKVLSLCQFAAGTFMLAAGLYCFNAAGNVRFAPLFVLYSISVAFYMPTLAISNSVAYNALSRSRQDPVSVFPKIRIFGTVGFICSMLASNWVSFGGERVQDSYVQLIFSGVLSFVLCAYALRMPDCPVCRLRGEKGVPDISGIRAFSLFKDRQMAMFFIFSMLLGACLQVTNGYANPFLESFGLRPEYAGSFAVRNSNALLAVSQVSETLCILLIPFFLKRFGIKAVMLISMVAWALRFGFFAVGRPDMPLVLFFIFSCIIYGVAFDFFNISGSLYIEKNTDDRMRSGAQGLFMLVTNGLGASIGTVAAGYTVDFFDCFRNPSGWVKAWSVFSLFSLAVAVAFAFLFKNPEKIR